MRNWALVVGINKYSKDSGQKRLKGAVNDACDFAEVYNHCASDR